MGISDLAIGAPRYCFSTQDYNEAKYGEDYKNISSTNNYLEDNNKENKCNELKLKREYYKEVIAIEHKSFIPIKIAVDKYIKQIKLINNFRYTQNEIVNYYNEVLIIQKIKNKWMCSKEKLDFINFKKIEDLNNRTNPIQSLKSICICNEPTFSDKYYCTICNKKDCCNYYNY
jgi:hypothetical protein